MSDLPRKVLLEAGLVLGRDEAREDKPRKWAKAQVWEPRRYAEQAHQKDFMRSRVLKRDHGICARCGTNCVLLYNCLAIVEAKIRGHKLGWDFHFGDFRRAVGLERTWRYPKTLWDAHMIVPKAEGGNDQDLANFQTLCLSCHKDETYKRRIGS
jgi:5-methylcytosine-specific restriction endonuclease McrA